MTGISRIALLCVLLAGCESALPIPTAAAPSPTPTPVMPTLSELSQSVGRPPSETGLPSFTPRPTTCPRPTPPLTQVLALQHGNLDLNAPYWLGSVQFFLVPCRDIDVIRQKYGLGPMTRVITEPTNLNVDPEDVRGRYFRAGVPVGEEATFVARLASHPEDFQYVEFARISQGCAGGCRLHSTVEPSEGTAGTSFTMRICCFDPGASVTKTFVLPSGRTIVIQDSAESDRAVPAGWGGSADDERGVYTVTVIAGQIGSMVRFRIR